MAAAFACGFAAAVPLVVDGILALRWSVGAGPLGPEAFEHGGKRVSV